MHAQSVDFMISFDLFVVFVCFSFSLGHLAFSVCFPFFLFLFSLAAQLIYEWKFPLDFSCLFVFLHARARSGQSDDNAPPLLGVAAAASAGLDLSKWWSLICILVYNAACHKRPQIRRDKCRIMCFIIYHNKLVECHVIGRQWRGRWNGIVAHDKYQSRTRCCCWPAVKKQTWLPLERLNFDLSFPTGLIYLISFRLLSQLINSWCESGSCWQGGDVIHELG